MRTHRMIGWATVLSLLIVPIPALAQAPQAVEVAVELTCEQATFVAGLAGGPYDLAWSFGDGATLLEPGVLVSPVTQVHAYTEAGKYEWVLRVLEPGTSNLVGQATGTLDVGPQVDLSSDPFPPLLTLVGGKATVAFTAMVSGGESPYIFDWDLDGDGLPDAASDPSSSASTFTYATGGKTTASVGVTDTCGLRASDSLAVVAVDPAETCHPTAQRIANAASALFPGQSSQMYTCEDIYAWFLGESGESNLGFGRMWHAIQLAQTLPELTWEEILQWQIDQTGWGTLLQINRYADALGEVSIADWVGMVVAGEATSKDVRTALRTAVREEIDPSDALDRLMSGATPGELTQTYRMAEDLGADPTQIDAFLALGLSLADLRRASKLADRLGVDWESVAVQIAEGVSWKDIVPQGQGQGQGPGSPSDDPLQTQERQRDQERIQEQLERQDALQLEHRVRTAERLADRYGVEPGAILSLLDGACQGDWGCVMSQFREQLKPDKGGKPK
jgi:hypothetical protein